MLESCLVLATAFVVCLAVLAIVTDSALICRHPLEEYAQMYALIQRINLRMFSFSELDSDSSVPVLMPTILSQYCY